MTRGDLFSYLTHPRLDIWNDAEAAIAALTPMLDIAHGMVDTNASNRALEAAIRALTTRRERREFLRDMADEPTGREARDAAAALKLARYFADPRTPNSIKNKLGPALMELSSELQIWFDHPALTERAATVIFEEIRQYEESESLTLAYRHLHDLLDSLPEMPEA